MVSSSGHPERQGACPTSPPRLAPCRGAFNGMQSARVIVRTLGSYGLRRIAHTSVEMLVMRADNAMIQSGMAADMDDSPQHNKPNWFNVGKLKLRFWRAAGAVPFGSARHGRWARPHPTAEKVAGRNRAAWFRKPEHSTLNGPVEWDVGRGPRLALEPGRLGAVGNRSDDVGCKIVQSDEARKIARRAAEPLRQAREVEFAMRLEERLCRAGAAEQAPKLPIRLGRDGPITWLHCERGPAFRRDYIDRHIDSIASVAGRPVGWTPDEAALAIPLEEPPEFNRAQVHRDGAGRHLDAGE